MQDLNFYHFWVDPDEIEGIKDKDEYFEYYKVDERRITKGSLNADIYSFSALKRLTIKDQERFRKLKRKLKNQLKRRRNTSPHQIIPGENTSPPFIITVI